MNFIFHVFGLIKKRLSISFEVIYLHIANLNLSIVKNWHQFNNWLMLDAFKFNCAFNL